jgi:alanine dehydrogenase
MNIGVPKEATFATFENRVGMAPDGVGILVAEGHHVYVQSKAGAISGFTDEDYRAAGAEVVYSAEEAWVRSDMVLKVRAPIASEYPFLHDGHILTGFLHMAVAPRSLLNTLLEKQVTAIAYETVQTDDGRLPIVIPMSEIAGRMIPIVAGDLLMNTRNGKGILLGGVPGVPAADVAVVGGGVVGYNAAKAFLGLGAQVTVLDNDPTRLRDLDDRLGNRASLMLATSGNLRKVCRFCDVLVGCILIPGERAPRLITRDMVRSMKPRSIIVDVSIDQGGCVETSRPTTLQSPTYVEENVIHYCVPNMSSGIAKTASYAMTYASLPYVSLIAGQAIERAIAMSTGLAKGIAVARGAVVSPAVASAFGLPSRSLASLFKAEA